MTKLCFSIDDPAESLHLQFLKDHAQDFKKHSELLHQLIPDNLMLLDYLLTFPDRHKRVFFFKSFWLIWVPAEKKRKNLYFVIYLRFQRSSKLAVTTTKKFGCGGRI
jgi:hypothetical protein